MGELAEAGQGATDETHSSHSGLVVNHTSPRCAAHSSGIGCECCRTKRAPRRGVGRPPTRLLNWGSVYDLR
jgi:hypothetical protein